MATLEQVQDDLRRAERRIEEQKAETERLVKSALEAVPEAVKTAIERTQAKANLPGRVPLSASGQGNVDGQRWSYSYEAEDEATFDRLRKGYRIDGDALARAGGYHDPVSRKLALYRSLGRFSPAARQYADATTPEKRFKGVSDFLISVYGTKSGSGFRGMDPRLKASFGEGGGDTGGFLIPEEFRSDLKALEIEGAQFEPLATTIPMQTMRLLMPTIRDTTHVGSVFGGVTGFWVPEAGQLSESEPTFGQIQLEAHKLTLYTVASNELINDSAVALEALIRQRFPQASTWFKETGFWNGVGGGMPEGLLNATAATVVSGETGQVTGTVVYENLLKMFSHMLPTSHKNAVWFIHPNLIPQLGTLSLSVGTGGSAIFMNPYNGGAQNAFPMTIFGRPVYISEHLPGVGTQGCIAYVDLSYYLIGTRQDLSFEASPHVKFINDQTVWRMIERLDGRPWIDSDLTLEHGSWHVSPFVLLASI